MYSCDGIKNYMKAAYKGKKKQLEEDLMWTMLMDDQLLKLQSID